MIRWIYMICVVWLLVLIQSTVWRVFTFSVPSVGSIGPELVAIFLVLVCLSSKSVVDSMIVGWLAGVLIDVANSGGAGITRVGPMSIAYCLACGLIGRVGQAMFNEKVVVRMFMVTVFCLVSHFLWSAMQAGLTRAMGWSDFGKLLMQICVSAVYSGAATLILILPMNLLVKMTVATRPSRYGG